MVDIFYKMVQNNNRLLPENYVGKVRNLLVKESQKTDFGNARGVRNTVYKVISNMDSRIASMIKNRIKLFKEDFITLKEEDLEIT